MENPDQLHTNEVSLAPIMVPASKTLVLLLNKIKRDAEADLKACIETDANERGYPPGTRFDHDTNSWLIPQGGPNGQGS